MPLIRIAVDFKTMTMHPDGQVWAPLWQNPSKYTMLRRDLRVILYDDDLEVEAVLDSYTDNGWWAIPDTTTYRELPADADSTRNEGAPRDDQIARQPQRGQTANSTGVQRESGIEPDTLPRMGLPPGDAVGSPWVRELYDYFAPIRQEAIDKGLTDEEINAAIDEAISAVRAKHR